MKLRKKHLSTHEAKPGAFLILVSKAPALVWEARKTGTGKLGLLVPNNRGRTSIIIPFIFWDPDWGHLTIKMSGHPPFGAQVMLNGHEYVACQAQKAGIEFTKQDNCFTSHFQPPQIWRKSQIPCPISGLQGACVNSASGGFIPPVCVLRSIEEQKQSALSLPVFRVSDRSTVAICCFIPAERWSRFSRR